MPSSSHPTAGVFLLACLAAYLSCAAAAKAAARDTAHVKDDEWVHSPADYEARVIGRVGTLHHVIFQTTFTLQSAEQTNIDIREGGGPAEEATTRGVSFVTRV
jgi:hypothetical protein